MRCTKCKMDVMMHSRDIVNGVETEVINCVCMNCGHKEQIIG